MVTIWPRQLIFPTLLKGYNLRYLDNISVKQALNPCHKNGQKITYLGVIILSMVGSLAKLRKRHTFSMDPFSSKSCLKNLAASMFTPIAANTIAKLSWTKFNDKDILLYKVERCLDVYLKLYISVTTETIVLYSSGNMPTGPVMVKIYLKSLNRHCSPLQWSFL